MYNVPRYNTKDGKSVNEMTLIFMTNIRNGIDVERSKDDLFKLTYPMALTFLKRYTNLAPLEDMVSDLSIAFMKTIKYYNPEASTVSFMNYYKKAIHTEVIQSRYGRYISNKQLARDFEANVGSLEHPLYDKHDNETGTIQDTVADDYWNGYFDKLIDYEGTVDDINRCMNKVLYKKQKGRRVRTTKSDSKKSFERWVEAMINEEEELTQQQVADELGIGKSGVNNAVTKYMPRLREELKNMGY